jgi:hypothetical protein
MIQFEEYVKQQEENIMTNEYLCLFACSNESLLRREMHVVESERF